VETARWHAAVVMSSRPSTPRQTSRKTRPLGSYLLRVFEERVELLRHHYELQDLASGQLLRFESLQALQRHLREQGMQAEPASVVAVPVGVAKPRR
jgi:hypothetical protein